MKVYHTLKHIYNENSKILILGSMPSVISRNNNFYYAHKSNRFWKIMENLFNTKLDSNLIKKEFLINNNIALWDVLKSCDINGSSDASITNVKVNDIAKIIKESKIKIVFITGKTAFYYYNKLLKSKINIEVIYLPSPSAANASFKLNDLIKEYAIIKNYL